MHKDISFNIGEGYRNIKLLPKNSLYYSLCLIFNYIFITILFSFFINLKYLEELSRTVIFPVSLKILPYSFLSQVDGLIVLLISLSLVFIYLMVYINKYFINEYITLNIHEIKLIMKLRGKNSQVRMPIIYTALFINISSIILVTSLMEVPYEILFKVINKNLIGVKLLKYQHFDTSLLVFLITITFIVVFLTSFYLFWEFKRGLKD